MMLDNGLFHAFSKFKSINTNHSDETKNNFKTRTTKFHSLYGKKELNEKNIINANFYEINITQ